ncbi:MAG: hypothetical protein QG566_164 [Patescibacteria group bacterium]|jgi:hypothetical protein|nr:hypothetical protein [Patescibacteria group bacterium]
MKTDLISILTQEGHSGILTGHCRVHLPEEEEFEQIDLQTFFENVGEYVREVKVTFSHGIQALGTLELTKQSASNGVASLTYFGGKHEKDYDSLCVYLDYKVERFLAGKDSHPVDFCVFKAILYR